MSRRGMFSEDEGGIGRRKIPEADMDFTSMIDVTFLLLIFFMVNPRDTSQQQADVPVAKHSVGVLKNGAVEVMLKARPGGVRLTLADGQEIDLERLKQHIADEVRKNRRQIVLKAERTVPYKHVAETARVIADVPGAEFFVGVKER